MKLPKLKMFSCYDSKIGVWMNPMVFQHVGQAERTWIEICTQKDSLPGKHPVDFTLFQIGEFDDESGVVTSLSAPVQVMSGVAATQVDS